MKKYLIAGFLFLALPTFINAQDIIPLYPEGIKNHIQSDETEEQNSDQILWISKVQTPTLEIYLPPKASAIQKAMIVLPGGGYEGLAYDWEGTEIAKWLNSNGIAAFVVKYRMPNSRSVETGRLAPLQDAQRAIRTVRKNAGEWNIDPHQIGVIGFSAGGHLASTLGTKFDYNDERYFDDKSIDTVSARPDFMALIYPVISMEASVTHMGSRNSLLGEDPEEKMIRLYSNELHVTDQTPPAFLVHSGDDDVVPIQNSLRFYEALQQHGIYAEMHIYPTGGHGYSLATTRGTEYLKTWPDRLIDWILSLP
tara:strand:- start:15138 stop:16064 length:927 start_codon:yes stop_codon:yes gene_type:complete